MPRRTAAGWCWPTRTPASSRSARRPRSAWRRRWTPRPVRPIWTPRRSRPGRPRPGRARPGRPRPNRGSRRLTWARRLSAWTGAGPPGNGEPGRLRVGEVVVDADHLTAAGREDGRGHDGAVAGVAMDPDLAGRDLPGPPGQIAERDVDRVRDVRVVPLQLPSHVQHDQVPARA